jgi:fatty acid desaturase
MMLAQGVLWIKSRRLAGFDSLNRWRAGIDSAVMATMWIALGLCLGAWRSLLVILIPMMTADAIAISYISTNHLLRPQVNDYDVLGSSMSVTTHKLLDLIHFHFSHHVEHHLFPSMGSKWAPLVRAELRRHVPGRFIAPSHWRALMLLYRTPRVYDGNRALVDLERRRRARFEDVETALMRGETRVKIEPLDLEQYAGSGTAA